MKRNQPTGTSFSWTQLGWKERLDSLVSVSHIQFDKQLIQILLFERWMSEKMDGVRAYWNGSQLLSRHGKPLDVPQWFTQQLPSDTPLDGELWMGRGRYEKLMSVINLKHSDNNNQWNEVGYYVFDLPSSKEPYEERMAKLQTK